MLQYIKNVVDNFLTKLAKRLYKKYVIDVKKIKYVHVMEYDGHLFMNGKKVAEIRKRKYEKLEETICLDLENITKDFVTIFEDYQNIFIWPDGLYCFSMFIGDPESATVEFTSFREVTGEDC